MRQNAINPLKPLRQNRKFEVKKLSFRKIIFCILISISFSTSIAYASESGINTEDFRLVKSAVCDPPVIHSDDPLGIRDGDNGEGYSKVPAAFVIALGFEFQTSKLVDAQIKGSLDEVLRLISASDNEISLSAPNPKIIHALRLSKEDDGIWVSLYLVDEIVLRTKCYKTGPELF